MGISNGGLVSDASRTIIPKSQKISGHQGALGVWKTVSASVMAPETNSVTRRARSSCVQVKPPRYTEPYEEEFLGLSYGFRPGRGPHDALDALVVAITSRKVNWILDADIQNFFGSVSREWLVRFLELRIGDKHHLPDPEMAAGGHPRRRDRDGR